MLKRGFFALVALAVALSAVMVPMVSSAASMEESKYFDITFKDGLDDACGNFSLSEDVSVDTSEGSDEFSLVDDETLGYAVGQFTGWGPLVYNNNNGEALAGYDLTEGLTVEAYVYMTDGEAEGNPIFFEGCGGCLNLQEYNSGTDHSIGFRCGDASAAGEGGEAGDPGYMMRNASVEETLPTGTWVHLIGTSDGTVNAFYKNGTKVASVDRAQSLLKEVNGGSSADFYIGESFFGGMFGSTSVDGRIAFVRVYKAFADDATAADLYSAATGEAPAPSNPTEVPSDDPSDDPTDEPDDAPTQTPGKTDNTKTFDLGLVSLAAVALSSAVAVKKRRK